MTFFSALVEAEKGNFWASTLSHKMCPRKQTTEPKFVSFFSGEVTTYTDTSYCIHILWEVSRSIFSGPPCIGNSYCAVPISDMPFFRKFPEIRKLQIGGQNFIKYERVSLDKNY